MTRAMMASRVDLRTKFAIMLVMITLVLSLATYGGLEAYKRQEIRRTEADVNETARLAAGQLEARLDEHSDYVAFIAQRAEAEPGDGKLLGEMLDNSRFFAARVVTANGTVVALRGPYPTDAGSCSGRTRAAIRAFVGRCRPAISVSRPRTGRSPTGRTGSASPLRSSSTIEPSASSRRPSA